MKTKRNLIVVVAVLVVISTAALLQAQSPVGSEKWSDWTPVTGSDALEYRWGILQSQAMVEFRNLTDNDLRFTYAVWTKGHDQPAKGSLEVAGNGIVSASVGVQVNEKIEVERVAVTIKK